MALTVVLDANIALAAALPLPYSPDERAVAMVALAAPDLWRYEVITGLRRAQWERIISDVELERALALLEDLDLELVHPSPALNRVALDWAARLEQNKAYDGHYLALAEHLGAQFWTADRRLANELRDRGVDWATGSASAERCRRLDARVPWCAIARTPRA